MTRVLVFGLCPLPYENTQKNFGPGIRAWQFIKPLLDENHDVTLIACRIPFIYPEDTPPETKSVKDRFTYYNFSEQVFLDSRRIQDLHDKFQPDAILAATIFSTSPLPNLKTTCPIWIDLFGHVMAEAQAKVHRYNDDSYIDHFLHHEIQALQIGDVFSTVSQAQGFATVGELGLMKRLNAANSSYPFCHTVPCAMDPVLYTHDKTVFRGRIVPDDAFVILWSGGYNTWTDIDTLFAALERCMKVNPDIWFVSTGGQIDGHDELTYPSFLKKIQLSPYKNRYILEGWIPKQDVHNYYFEANLGINIDRFMYEGMFGSKNRVLDWMRAGLPSLIGELCELSYEFPAKNIAYSYKLNNSKILADKILELALNPESVKKTGERAREYGLKHVTFHKTTKVFREWLQNPTRSPDHKDPDIAGKVENPFETKNSDYVSLLDSELNKKRAHIKKLEKYIRHIEKQFKKQTSSTQHGSMDSKRPHMQAKPLLLPETPSVSIILVTWNGIQYIDECLVSAIENDYRKTQIIVIDNYSTDGTCDHIAGKYPEIKLIRNKSNIGFTRGVNQGINIATGEIIFLLNQDAIMQSGLLKNLIETLRNPQIAIAGCKILYPDRKTLQHAGGILHENGLTDHYGAGETDLGQYDEDRDCVYVTGAAFAFKKQLVEEIGIFDTRYSPAYFEELDYCIRASRAGYRIRYVHNAVALHYESTSTGKFSNRFYYLYHRNRLKFILKHYSARYFIGTFRRFEWKWLKKHAPKEQYFPMFKAYARVIHRIIWVFIRTAKDRIKR